MQKYRATPEGKAATKAAKLKRYATPEGKKIMQEGKRRWKKTEKGKLVGRKAARKAYQYGYHIQATYGLAIEQYNEMAKFGCHICGAEAWEQPHGRLHVDHNHATGEVRGLLCHGCNRGLGCFRDDPSRMLLAIKYLEKH
jgi:hypothetical protein